MSDEKRISDIGFRISDEVFQSSRGRSSFRWLAVLLVCAGAYAADKDVMLRAMRAEIDRSRDLKFAGLESPYYVEANVDDVNGFTVSATLGGLLSANLVHFRSPRVQVRDSQRHPHGPNPGDRTIAGV